MMSDSATDRRRFIKGSLDFEILKKSVRQEADLILFDFHVASASSPYILF
jgi:hypothetical protein